jgi:hypothetical protein
MLRNIRNDQYISKFELELMQIFPNIFHKYSLQFN